MYGMLKSITALEGGMAAHTAQVDVFGQDLTTLQQHAQT
jgi:hypothetical protein